MRGVHDDPNAWRRALSNCRQAWRACPSCRQTAQVLTSPGTSPVERLTSGKVSRATRPSSQGLGEGILVLVLRCICWARFNAPENRLGLLAQHSSLMIA